MEKVNDYLKSIKDSNEALRDMLDKYPNQIEKMIATNNEIKTPPEGSDLTSDY
tara:strand:- start:393 stop:551 length:159 start_codon:yes stop_codon:yes gene_type:complete